MCAAAAYLIDLCNAKEFSALLKTRWLHFTPSMALVLPVLEPCTSINLQPMVPSTHSLLLARTTEFKPESTVPTSSAVNSQNS
jgi:hypothetical protein